MDKSISFLLGAVFGAIAGALTAYLAAAQIPNELHRLGAGALVGGFVGMVTGSVAGEAGKRGEGGGSRALVGFFAGAVAGAIGATQSDLVGQLIGGAQAPNIPALK